MSDLYVLKGHEAVPTEDYQSWSQMFSDREARRVGADKVGDADVSTVFLGMDHAWGDGPPLLFETMIFGGEASELQWRWTTWEEAEVGHKRIVETLRSGGNLDDIEWRPETSDG
jgi:hypothetical protein